MKREKLSLKRPRRKPGKRAIRGSLPGTWRINWHSRIGRWQCRVFAKGEPPIQVGTFADLVNAVIARNVFLAKRYGQLGLLLEWQRQHPKRAGPASSASVPDQVGTEAEVDNSDILNILKRSKES